MTSLPQRPFSRSPRRRFAVGMAVAGLTMAGLAATPAAPAHAALPSQCVTSGSTVTCTLSQNTQTDSMDLEIPAEVSSIQVHAVGERGGDATGHGGVLIRGGAPSMVDASVAVTPGQLITATLRSDGGAAGASSGDVQAGAGGSSVAVSRGSELIVQAAGGGGAGAAEPVPGTSNRWSQGGGGDWYGEDAAPGAGGASPAGGGVPGTEYDQGGYGGPGARLYGCSTTIRFPDGVSGTAASGGRGGDGEWAGGGGGGGRYGGGGGGAGGSACGGYSYGAGGGGGLSVVPWTGATWSRSSTESYLVRITFWVGPRSAHSPTAMSFGRVAVGSTSSVQTMTVTNTGPLALTLGTGVLHGVNANSFRKVSDTCSSSTLTSGAACQVGLQFAPLTAGTLSATFTLPDNSQANPHVLPLSGTGAAQSFHSPSALLFGEVAVGTSSGTQTITVTNTGSIPLELGTSAVGGANQESFVRLNDRCSSATVAPGASCSVGVQFRPSALGAHNATYTLPDNSSDSPHIVPLSGTGTRPIPVTSVSSMNFGAQEVGKVGAAQLVTLTNTGTGPLVVSGTGFVGTNASDFSTLSNSCAGAALAPGSSCAVAIRMTASGVGQRSGSFKFTHNGAQPWSGVSLTGVGTPPADLKIRGIGSIYTGRDHWVTRTVAGPGKLMTYPLAIYNEDTVARSYKIALSRTGAAATAEVWTSGFGAKSLPQHNPGVFTTAVVQPKQVVTYNLRVTPTAAGQGTSFVAVALLSDAGGLIEGLSTATNTGAPLNGTSAFELFSKQGSQLFVGGPVDGQTSTGPALNVGSSAPFTLRLKNNGTSSQRIGLRLTDTDGCAGSFAVTVTAGGKSVTVSAYNGTYLTPLLAPTKYQDVFVSIKRIAAGCPSKTIRAQSLNNGVAVRTSYLLANAAYNAATD